MINICLEDTPDKYGRFSASEFLELMTACRIANKEDFLSEVLSLFQDVVIAMKKGLPVEITIEGQKIVMDCLENIHSR